MIYLIVGLGNPGSQYQKTRHNIGFQVVEALALKKGWVFHSSSECQGKVAHGEYGGKALFLLKPHTFMNASGEALRAIVGKLKVPLDRVIIVHDDTAFPLGEIRLRGQGSSGGHKGLESVAEHLGTEYYARLRVGIGSPQGEVLADYVLSSFTKLEEEKVIAVIERSLFLLDVWIEKGKEAAMQLANAKKKLEKEEGEQNV